VKGAAALSRWGGGKKILNLRRPTTLRQSKENRKDAEASNRPGPDGHGRAGMGPFLLFLGSQPERWRHRHGHFYTVNLDFDGHVQCTRPSVCVVGRGYALEEKLILTVFMHDCIRSSITRPSAAALGAGRAARVQSALFSTRMGTDLFRSSDMSKYS